MKRQNERDKFQDTKRQKETALPSQVTRMPEKQPSLAEISHELRLPLANLRLLVETLLDGALDERETSKRMLKRAHQEIERLQGLVSKFMSSEQLTNSLLTLGMEWSLLHDCVDYALEATKTLAAEQSIKLIVEIEDGWKIYANKQQLEQVILNLLENAIKFTNAGGQVHIRSGKIIGSFFVSDTGIGINEAEIPQIFERFYRIDKTNNRPGTGLGLSIVKQVLERHGAKITVTSKEGEGSCFYLEFPSPLPKTKPNCNDKANTIKNFID